MDVNEIQAGIMVAALFVLLRLYDFLADLLRTIKRIEARLALISPTEDESRFMKDDRYAVSGIRDRAMHPDIWTSQMVKEQGNLRGEEWRKVRDSQRYREKRHRD